MKHLYIGAGEAGTVVVDRLSRKFAGNKEYLFKTINSSPNDSEKATNINEEDRHLLKNVDGLAKRMELVAELIQEQGQEILGEVFAKPFQAGVTHITLVSSTGGGTGSGMTTQLARILKTNMPRKHVRVILITPFAKEDARTKKNTSFAIQAMKELGVPTRLISNGNYQTYEGKTKQSVHDSINNYIVESEFAILEANKGKTLSNNTDKAEINTVVFESGYQFVVRIKLSAKDKEKNTKDIINKIGSSLDLGFNNDVHTYSLTVLEATTEIESKLELQEILDQFGKPIETSFSTHIMPIGTDSYITIMLSGCSFPQQVQGFYEEVLKHQEEIEKLERKDINIDLSKLRSFKKEDKNEVTTSVFDILNGKKQENVSEKKEIVEFDISKWDL